MVGCCLWVREQSTALPCGAPGGGLIGREGGDFRCWVGRIRKCRGRLRGESALWWNDGRALPDGRGTMGQG